MGELGARSELGRPGPGLTRPESEGRERTHSAFVSHHAPTVLSVLLDVLLPTRCGACGTTGPSPCARCWRDLRPAARLPSPPRGLDALHAALSYEAAARELVARLKYRNERSAVTWLAQAMASVLPSEPIAREPVVTWAPTTPARRRMRGFDHAEALARELAAGLGLGVSSLLVRSEGSHQTGLSPRERRGNEIHVEARPDAPSRVLLVDDVVTTGTTLAAAARALRSAGATNIIGVAAAVTPLKAPPD